MTGDVGGVPARAGRRGIPAIRCDRGEYRPKAIERANETLRHHVGHYRSGKVPTARVRLVQRCSVARARAAWSNHAVSAGRILAPAERLTVPAKKLAGALPGRDG